VRSGSVKRSPSITGRPLPGISVVGTSQHDARGVNATSSGLRLMCFGPARKLFVDVCQIYHMRLPSGSIICSAIVRACSAYDLK
jgi:hypothetical protein